MNIPSNLLLAANMLSCGWLIFHAMSFLIEISSKWPKRLLLFAGCSLLSATVIFIGDPFNILAASSVYLIIVLLSCRGSFWKRVTIGMMFSSTLFSFNMLRDNYIPYLLPEFLRQINHGFFFSKLLNLPFALTLYLCTRKFAPDPDYTLSESMWRLLLLLTIAPFGIVLNMAVLFLSCTFDLHIHWEYAALPLIALLSFISLLWCVTVLARGQKLERQNMFMEINRKYYEAMEQQHFEIRRLRHDLANHIQMLCALPQEKRDAYIQNLQDAAALSQPLSLCGDATVNAVLTVKKSILERCHIRLRLELKIPGQLPYARTDLCALYANALDNAIEACMKLDEAKREITLKSRAGKGLFCLEISNPDTGKPNVPSPPGKIPGHGLIPPTSKPDKANHGLGLKSIQEIVKRYHGSMEIQTENNVFNLFLYLPLPEPH